MQVCNFSQQDPSTGFSFDYESKGGLLLLGERASLSLGIDKQGSGRKVEACSSRMSRLPREKTVKAARAGVEQNIKPVSAVMILRRIAALSHILVT